MLKGKSIILGVSGGIAAYKSAYLCSMLVKQHADVTVIMTENALNFIAPATFEALTGNRTLTDTFDRNHEFSTEHVSLADKADLIIVAPATANVLAKFANGIADDMLTTTVLACDCPKIAAPAMNTRMYYNPVTEDNMARLKGYGWELIDPDSGRLACGTSGKGRMPEPERLLEAVIHEVSASKDMAGLKVLVSAGPTREDLDPVRFITNHSSGKMGYAVAKAAAARGADVTLVTGPVDLPAPAYMDVVNVVSANDMYNAIADREENSDIIIMAAAVADYTPVYYSDHKIKKQDGEFSLELERTDDILRALGENKRPGQTLVGFAMETENVVENGEKKLISKNADLIAANSAVEEGSGFQVDTNRLTLITAKGNEELPVLSKDKCAHKLLDAVLKLR